MYEQLTLWDDDDVTTHDVDDGGSNVAMTAAPGPAAAPTEYAAATEYVVEQEPRRA